MIDRTVGCAADPAEIGLLHHHGPEVLPVVELIVGGALPVAAAVWMGRLRSLSGRLTGGTPHEGAPLTATEAAPARARSKAMAVGPPVQGPPRL